MKNLAFLAVILLTAVAASAETVSVSILSILRPSQLSFTLISPDSAIRKNPSGQFVLASKVTQHIQRNTPMPLRISCNEPCTFRIEIPGQITRNYTGTALQFTRQDSTISIVLILPSEKLLASVLSSEAGEFRDPNALRAFAVVARSFLRAGTRHPELDSDFCDTTHCQVFQAFPETREIQDALNDTRDLVLTYHQAPFRPFYFRSCGGSTASYEEIWRQPSPDYPFIGVSCPCSATWEAKLNSTQMEALLGFPVTHLKQNSHTISFFNGTESVEFGMEEFRNLAGRNLGWNHVRSNSFRIIPSGTGAVIHGKGFGHRVGFCQKGSEILALRGLSFQSILQHYFPNTEIRTAPQRH